MHKQRRSRWSVCSHEWAPLIVSASKDNGKVYSRHYHKCEHCGLIEAM